MKRLSRVLSCAAVALGFALQPHAAGGSGDSTWQKDPSDWSVELYPVLGWGPSVHTNITVPDHPSGPGLGNGTASSSLNGAAFAGFLVEKNKWSVQGNLLWAGLEADRSNPTAKLGLDIIYGQALVGREVLPGLALEGGVRRLALDITALVANSPEVSRKPGITDPRWHDVPEGVCQEMAVRPPWRRRWLWRGLRHFHGRLRPVGLAVCQALWHDHGIWPALYEGE